MQVKKQQFEPDMEKLTGSKLGKEYLKVMHDLFTTTILIKTSLGAAMGDLAHGWAFGIPTVESFNPYPNAL